MRKLLIVLAIIFLIAGAFGVIRGYLVYKRFTKFVHKKIRQEEKGVITNIVLKSTAEGKLIWVLKADRAKVEGNLIKLENVRINYSGDRVNNVSVIAERGFLDKKKQVGILEGSVLLKLKNGTLKAKRLIWNIKVNKICVPGSFEFYGKYKIWGNKLCFYPKKEIIRIYRLRKMVIE